MTVAVSCQQQGNARVYCSAGPNALPTDQQSGFYPFPLPDNVLAK